MNPLKQNTKLKEYLGWFVSLSLPFTSKCIMEQLGIPIISALFYWFVCGILLRLSFEKKLPYFKPQTTKIKKELILLALATLLSSFLFFNHRADSGFQLSVSIINLVLYALLNGIFEPLVLANIFNLAGCKIKLAGFAASITYTNLMLAFFWQQFMPIPISITIFFAFVQTLMLCISLLIYVKTKDLTLISIQSIIYNFIIIMPYINGIGSFLHI